MLIVMRKTATDSDLLKTKEALNELDLDFHQSTGAQRIILGVIGNTSTVSIADLRALPGVLEVFKIPEED